MNNKAKSFIGLIQSQFVFGDFQRKFYIPNINHRVSVIKKIVNVKNDPNRELMIKFKYNQSTVDDEKHLHDNIKKLIYKVMHNGYVKMDFDDIYQEIWKKIIKSKHTWDENKGTKVSTWIVTVATSVMCTLRQKAIKHNSRYCLYNDIKQQDEENGTDMCDKLKLSDDIDDKFIHNMDFYDDFRDFYNKLNEQQKIVLSTCFDVSENSNSRKKRNGSKIPMKNVRIKLGLKEEELNNILNNMKNKFYENFECHSHTN